MFHLNVRIFLCCWCDPISSMPFNVCGFYIFTLCKYSYAKSAHGRSYCVWWLMRRSTCSCGYHVLSDLSATRHRGVRWSKISNRSWQKAHLFHTFVFSLSFFLQVIMGDRASAERACKDPNPIIDGRKANVNLAILGAKPRGNLTTGKLMVPQLEKPRIWIVWIVWEAKGHFIGTLDAPFSILRLSLYGQICVQWFSNYRFRAHNDLCKRRLTTPY